MSKLLSVLLLVHWVTLAEGQAFITVWDTNRPGITASNQITIPTAGGGYNYSIYWEDERNPAINGSQPGPITGNYTINFPSPGLYRVSITGNFPRIFFDEQGDYYNTPLTSDAKKLYSIERWGNIQWTSMAHAFQGCSNLRIRAWDLPDLSRVTDMSYMFKWTFWYVPVEAFRIGSWDVSNVKNMSHLFDDVGWFNEPLDDWDVSNVTDMSWMFYGADYFNQPLGSWDVSNVLTMDHMFNEAYHFNQPLDSWNVSNVTDMSWMFELAADFNQPLGKWNIINVRNMNNMLDYSGLDVANYDQTLIGWASQNAMQGVPLGAEGLKYCAGEAARTHLIMNKSWSITGDSKDTQLLPPPVLSVIQPLCKDSTGTIAVVTTHNGNEQYSFDGGVTFQSGIVKTGLLPGSYDIMYKKSESCSSASTTVEIDSPPVLATPVITGSPVVCPNVVEVDYTASIPEYAYQWFIEGGTLVSQQGKNIKVDWGPTNFNASIKAVGLNEHNCPTDTASFPVKIQIQLKPEILSGMDSVCYNFRTGVPYQSTYTNGSVYTWFTDGGTLSEGQSTDKVKIDWKDLGKYRLWVKEENTTSTDYCQGTSDTLNITVFKDLAAITMNFVSVDYKDDTKVKLQWDATLLERISDLIIVSRRTAVSNEPWKTVATLQKNVQSYLDQNVLTDQHIYEYKIEGFNKCDEGLQTVIHNTIKLEGEKEEEQQLIDLYWNDYNGWEGVERYEIWRKLDGDTTYRLIDVTPGGITTYSGKHGGDGFTHLLRIKAKKQNENTISWSNEIELDFENPIDMIPNVITPDGDDKNEYFVIPRLNLYPENYLKIINRWGELVYEKRNYQNDWNANGLTTGTYYYSLHLARNNKTLNGWVQVVR